MTCGDQGAGFVPLMRPLRRRCRGNGRSQGDVPPTRTALRVEDPFNWHYRLEKSATIGVGVKSKRVVGRRAIPEFTVIARRPPVQARVNSTPACSS